MSAGTAAAESLSDGLGELFSTAITHSIALTFAYAVGLPFLEPVLESSFGLEASH